MGLLYYFATIIIVAFVMYLFKIHRYKRVNDDTYKSVKVSIDDVLYKSVNNKSNEIYKKRLLSDEVEFYFK